MPVRQLTVLLLMLFVSFLYSGFLASSEMPPVCTESCASPYGQLLGRSPRGVAAYSNCSSGCVIFSPADHEGTYTGIKWQCVEYARRWLLINKGVVYGDVDVAIDIWDKIDHYRRVGSNEEVATTNYVNGSAVVPQVGDLLIYSRVMFGGTGHVAVVTRIDIENGLIEVGEQNFSNESWNGTFARKLPLLEKNGLFWILDSYLVGWKRMQHDCNECR